MNIAQQIINGIVLGSGYACIALGWTILLGVARLVNFAHGQLYMLGAFIAWYAITKLGLPYPLAIVVAVVFSRCNRPLMQSAMMRLVMTQNLTSLMIVTLGLGYVIQGVSAVIFGGNPQILPGTLARAKMDIGPLWFTWQDVLVLVVTLCCMARCGGSPSVPASVRSFARWRRTQARGIVRDQRAGRISWYSCSRARRWALGAALVAPRLPILTSMGFNRGYHDLRRCRPRRYRSIGGALAAGIGLGLFTAFFGAFVARLHDGGCLCADAAYCWWSVPRDLAAR